MSARAPEALRRSAGFTLLELMVAGAVGLIIIAAALAAFDLQAQFARNTERLLSAQASTGLAMTMMQRDLENAGIRFRGGPQTGGSGTAFAAVVRPYDNLGANVVALTNDYAGTSSIVATAGAAGGFLPGTDAFEVLMGSAVSNPARTTSQVVSKSPSGVSQAIVTITPNPFVAGEIGTTNDFASVLMFWNEAAHCMGRVIGPPLVTPTAASIQLRVQSVDWNLVPSNAPWPADCPKSTDSVGILEQRRRYLVYRTDSAAGRPSRVGLHVQSNPDCDPFTTGLPCSTNLGAPQMASEGVDDLQIAWRVPDALAPATSGWCALATGQTTCNFDQVSTAPTALTASIYGVQLYLSSRGNEDFRRPNEPVPTLLNHVPAVPTDGIVRSLMQTSFMFRNTVTP